MLPEGLRKKPGLLVVGIASAAVAAWLGFAFVTDRGPLLPRPVLGQPAPQVSAAEIQGGQVIQLQQFRGKVLLVNFWASWCEPCREEHANLLRLKEVFADRQGFVMLGVAHRDRTEDARDFLRRWGEGYPNLADPDGTVGAAFGVTSLPASFLIDASGKVRCRHFGPVRQADIERLGRDWIRPALDGHFHSCG